MIVIRSRPVYYAFIFLVSTLIGRIFFLDNGWVAIVVVALLVTAVEFVVLDLLLHVKWGADDRYPGGVDPCGG